MGEKGAQIGSRAQIVLVKEAKNDHGCLIHRFSVQSTSDSAERYIALLRVDVIERRGVEGEGGRRRKVGGMGSTGAMLLGLLN